MQADDAYGAREQALLDEHQEDHCEVEMGVCLSGCRPSCPPAYCTSERHKGPESPTWPCRVVAPILGFRNADAYWKDQADALDAYYADAYGKDQADALDAYYAALDKAEERAPDA